MVTDSPSGSTQPNWGHTHEHTCCTCTYFGGVVHVDYVDTGVHCARGRYAVTDGYQTSCSHYGREPGADDEGDDPARWKRVVGLQSALIARHGFVLAWARPAYGVWESSQRQRPLLPGVRRVDDWDELLVLYGHNAP